MTADGGESSPISATRSGLVPAKGGAGKGRKQQSSLRSYFGFTSPAAPSPASPTSPAAPETPVQSQGGDTNTRVVPGEHRQRKDWAGGMEKAQRRGVEPARTDFSEKEMELFRKLTERYQSGSSKRWVKISQAWDGPFKRGRGRSAHTSPGPQSNSTHIFMGHGPDIWRGNKKGRSLTLPMPLLTPVRSANGHHGMYWTPVLPPLSTIGVLH